VDVAGAASTASIGLQKLTQLAPDVVLLSATLDDIGAANIVRMMRASWPMLPIIILCEPSDYGAALDAVKSGANGYVAKPNASSSPEERARFSGELLSKLRALTGNPLSTPSRMSLQPMSAPAAPPVTALAIGASTGGPNALARLFASFPLDLPVPILIVQHMPPIFTRMLAERLRSRSGFDVVEATHGELAVPCRAYIAPGDFHMAVMRDPAFPDDVRIVLDQEPAESSCRPAIDVLFRSIARVYGAGALAAVLTGMGHDGSRGAAHIVDVGGAVVVQDARTSVVATMPASVASATRVDGTYAIDEMAQELTARVRRCRPSVMT
jgi:two-component system chemotaxis response regulator CheB